MKSQLLALSAAVLAAGSLQAQTWTGTTNLDGASGSNIISGPITLSGTADVNLQFQLQYLVVAGGGGGGTNGGGGGGAGGLLTNISSTPFVVAPTSYGITVGAGGAGGAASATIDLRRGEKGQNSVFDTFTANGGGGGNTLSGTVADGRMNGGSGGGGGGRGMGGGSATAGQGNSGGASKPDVVSNGAGGGGGGANAAGTDGTNTLAGGNGGAGRDMSAHFGTIGGASGVFSGGGGGGAFGTGSTGGTGGAGGGANGVGTFVNAPAGTANTGGGGGGGQFGGSGSVAGGAGGSGLVAVRYAGTSAATGGSITTFGDYTVHTFTTTGASSLDFSALNLSQRLGVDVTGDIGGSGNLAFSGPGRMVLSGTNSYSGTTTVSAGTLLINGDNSGATGAVNVASGAVLGGNGTVGGATTISGTHNPGNSPGLQTFNSALTYNNGSTVNWELIGNTSSGRGTNFDGIDLTLASNLTINAVSTMNLVFNGAGSTVDWTDTFWNTDRSWLFYSLDTGSVTGAFALGSVSLDSLGVSLGSIRSAASFSINQSGNDILVNYAVIPEPGTSSLLLLLGAAGLITRRKLRKG